MTRKEQVVAVFKEEHGGGCCGRYHISNFELIDSVEVRRCTKKVKEILESPNESGEDGFHEELGDTMGDMCAEITISEHQWGCKDPDGKTLLESLLALGFEEVFQFRNPNSYNIVKVLMHSNNKV